MAVVGPDTPVEIKPGIESVESIVWVPAYEIRREMWRLQGSGDEPTPILVARTVDGLYIGDQEMANLLCGKYGIRPELRTPTSSVCSIGFSERDQKWYGWSHRAIFGFGIGHVVKVGEVIAGKIPIGTRADTLEDCRRFAEAFAEGVS